MQVNLLVATSVAEEGLDIRTCSLVVRFDLPETLSSYIQSRGRARMQKSLYVLLLERFFLYFSFFYIWVIFHIKVMIFLLVHLKGK